MIGRQHTSCLVQATGHNPTSQICHYHIWSHLDRAPEMSQSSFDSARNLLKSHFDRVPHLSTSHFDRVSDLLTSTFDNVAPPHHTPCQQAPLLTHLETFCRAVSARQNLTPTCINNQCSKWLSERTSQASFGNKQPPRTIREWNVKLLQIASPINDHV